MKTKRWETQFCNFIDRIVKDDLERIAEKFRTVPMRTLFKIEVQHDQNRSNSAA